MPEYPVINRELSWIEFNARVLQEARKQTSFPFSKGSSSLGIVSSNFDEFFMVRIAALKTAIRGGERVIDGARVAPDRLLAMIILAGEGNSQIFSTAVLSEDVLPALAAEGLEVVPPKQWTSGRKALSGKLLHRAGISLSLTPLRIEDDAFPSTGNLQMHCAFELEKEDGEKVYARRPGPAEFGTLHLPSEPGCKVQQR